MVDGCVKALLALFGWLLRLLLTTLDQVANLTTRLGSVAGRHSETSVSSGAAAFNPEFQVCPGISAFDAAASGTVSAVRSTSQFPDRSCQFRAPSQRAHGFASLAFPAQVG